jgi:hypothetical protein
MSETKLYAFHADEVIVPINARPQSETPVIVYHKLRKPTFVELSERESQIKYELVEISSREDEIQSEEETANARLWDKIAIAVRGYRGVDDWRDLTAEDKAAMRPGHKTAAIRAMYTGFCEVEGDEDGVSIGADTWTVKQSIGVKRDAPDFVVIHTLREPTEAERVKYKRSASSTSYVKGAKKSQVRIKTNLKAYVELYDALIQCVEGAKAVKFWTDVAHDEGLKKLFLREIDPMWKRQVVQTLMSNLEAQLSD